MKHSHDMGIWHLSDRENLVLLHALRKTRTWITIWLHVRMLYTYSHNLFIALGVGFALKCKDGGGD